MKVVVVGGEEQFAKRIEDSLRARWPAVSVQAAGVTLGTLLLLENIHPDLLIVGPCRPGVCYDLLGRVRKASDVPIAVVSGRDDVAYRVRALESGADEWLSESALPKELAARVGALVRRYGENGGSAHKGSPYVHHATAWSGGALRGSVGVVVSPVPLVLAGRQRS